MRVPLIDLQRSQKRNSNNKTKKRVSIVSISRFHECLIKNLCYLHGFAFGPKSQEEEREKQNTLAPFTLTHLFYLCRCALCTYINVLYCSTSEVTSEQTFLFFCLFCCFFVCAIPIKCDTHFSIRNTWINLMESIINFFWRIKHKRGKCNSMLGYFSTRYSCVIHTAYRCYSLLMFIVFAVLSSRCWQHFRCLYVNAPELFSPFVVPFEMMQIWCINNLCMQYSAFEPNRNMICGFGTFTITFCFEFCFCAVLFVRGFSKRVDLLSATVYYVRFL